MTNRRTCTHAGWSTVLLILVLALLLWFSSPQWVVPPAAWLAPFLIVRFMRSRKLVRGALVIWLVSSVVNLFANQGFVPLPLVGHFIFTPLAALVAVIPYLLDRAIAPHMKGFRATLVLPLAWTVLDYAQSFFFDGTIMSPAYTQADNIVLIQIASLTGVWGITFLLFWFAAVANWVWEQVIVEHNWWRSVRRGMGMYAASMIGILLFGSVRLLFAPTATMAMRVAGISVDQLGVAANAYAAQTGQELPQDLSYGDPELTQAMLALDAFVADPGNPQFAPVHAKLDALYTQLFALTRREAQRGAQVVTWTEGNAWVLTSYEPTLIERARQLVREHKIYLYMPIIALTPGTHPFTASERTVENKIVTIGPDGTVLATYRKTKLPVGEISIRGNGRIPVERTSLGALAAAICYDLDTPSFIRQVGQAGVDVMLAPSADWKEVAQWHPQGAKLRAVENGFALVRPVSRGMFLLTDQYGRSLATLDWFSTPEPVMAVTVPVQHVATIYTRIGDSFAWACIGGLALMAVLASRQRRFLPRAAHVSQQIPQA